MIIRDSGYVFISQNSNNVYWEHEGIYPDWAAICLFRFFPAGQPGQGVEPHYHDADEIWLFASGRGEVWLNGHAFEVTPNTLVYTPMGAIHRFQMFTPYDNIALVTPLERQRRAAHLLVERDGPPVPTVPGFVVPGAQNTGPLANRGARCPLSELRLVTPAGEESWPAAPLARHEYWLGVEGAIRLLVSGHELELTPGDVALIRAGTVRRVRPNGPGRAALARE